MLITFDIRKTKLERIPIENGFKQIRVHMYGHTYVQTRISQSPLRILSSEAICGHLHMSEFAKLNRGVTRLVFNTPPPKMQFIKAKKLCMV
jgi:hypothetical protein